MALKGIVGVGWLSRLINKNKLSRKINYGGLRRIWPKEQLKAVITSSLAKTGGIDGNI